MAVSGKGRRKIIVGGRTYLWWVGHDDPECLSGSDTYLMVVSADGRFGVRFFLGQLAERSFLIVLGREFHGLRDAGGPWIRVLCPHWVGMSAVTPAVVRAVIEWCSSDRPLVRVDYRGNIV
ncbi:MAG TPA: hypothetical protein DEQ43_23620 [Nocardioides bacterium]|nr:hypothetical protein [Nocardioides sp.]